MRKTRKISFYFLLLIATKYDKVLSSSELPRTHRLSCCSTEEADTRELAYLQDIVLHDHSVIIMRTVNTDWIVIVIAQFYSLTPELEELNVEFGTGKTTGKFISCVRL